MQKLSRAEAIGAKKEFLENWTSEDGLGLLKPKEDGGDREPFPGRKLRTAANDNGILFIMYFYWLCYRHNILEQDDLDRLEVTLGLLMVPGHHGLYHRNPGRVGRHESHDNIDSICSGDVLSRTFFHAQEIVNYGVKHGYVYDNVNPSNWNPLRWRQGSNIAMYKNTSFNTPTMWHHAWLDINFITSAYTPATNGSSNLLSWQYFITLEYLLEHYRDRIPHPKSMEANMTFADFWKNRLLKKTDGLGVEIIIQNYFTELANPIRRLAWGIRF